MTLEDIRRKQKLNDFLYRFYWNIKVNHKNAIRNQTSYALLTPTEKECVVTTNAHDISNFEFRLLDDERKLTEFKDRKDKVPGIGFTIQIIQ